MNQTNVIQGFFVPNQNPLDPKTISKSESILKNLGTDEYLAFTYYDGLIVLCTQENSFWKWREGAVDEIGLMDDNFQYPAAHIVNGINYSLKFYNFFKIPEKLDKGLYEGTAQTLKTDIETRVVKVIGKSLVLDTEISKLVNLDNTKDIDKPVSTAQQAAIDAAIEAQITDSIALSDPTIAIVPTGNVHILGVGPGTYSFWGGMVIPANHTGTLRRVGGVFSVSTVEVTGLDLKADKTELIEKANLAPGKNLFNWEDADIELNTIIGGDGSLYSGNAGFIVTGFIPVTVGQSIICNKYNAGFGSNFYDANKVKISTTLSSGALTVPSGAFFVRKTVAHLVLQEIQIELGTVSTSVELYKLSVTPSELGNVVFADKIKNDFTSTNPIEVLSAPRGKNLNDRLVINETALEGTQFEVLLPENIDVEDFTYSIGSTGTIIGTKTGGRVYPFFRIPTAKEIQFYVTNSSPFVILGGNATSIIALGVAGGAHSLLYRFTNTDALTLLGSISIGGAINDTICRVTYKNGTYKIYSDNVLKATVLSANLSSYAESLTPILGLVIYEPFTSIPDLAAIVSDRITYIENKAKTILPNPFKGQKYTSLGDSIEAANITQPLLIEALELGDYQDLSQSGTTLLNNGASSGCFKYLNVNTDAKLITCNLGTNDFGVSLPLGTLGDTGNNTFYGALKIVTEGLVTNHPLARIFFYTIQQRDYLGGGGNVAGMTNDDGATVEEFNEAIKIMCRKASIPVIDLYQDWGVSLQNIDDFTYDRLHPNTEGHNRRAMVIINKIKQYGL